METIRIIRGYKTELDLNNRQRTACAKHAGAARYAYNWGLRRKIDAYEATGTSPTAIDLHRELNALKRTELGWMYEVSKCAPQEALRNLDRAFAHFFRRVELKKQGKLKGPVGFPRFKSRKRGLGSFRLTGSIHIFEDSIQLPRLGRLRLKERGYLPTSGVNILSATVSERAGRWFVSVQVEEEVPAPTPAKGEAIGVDLGVRTLATRSDGIVYENPKALYCPYRTVPWMAHRGDCVVCSASSPANREAAVTARRPGVGLPACTTALPMFGATHCTRRPATSWRKPSPMPIDPAQW
jgi:putative transposase